MVSAAKPVINSTTAPLLTVSDLTVSYAVDAVPVRAVDALSFAISKDETLGIVGESGSGKTQTALALLGLLAETATVAGEAIYNGQDLLQLSQTRTECDSRAEIRDDLPGSDDRTEPAPEGWQTDGAGARTASGQIPQRRAGRGCAHARCRAHPGGCTAARSIPP